MHWIFTTFVLMTLVAGCGKNSGPTRYQLSGTVTLDGQPIPAGSLMFEPDESKGNKGPGVYVEITDGKYATLPQAGVVGGPHLVRLSPPSLESGSSEELVKAQFRPQVTKVDVPTAKVTMNLEFASDE